MKLFSEVRLRVKFLWHLLGIAAYMIIGVVKIPHSEIQSNLNRSNHRFSFNEGFITYEHW